LASWRCWSGDFGGGIDGRVAHDAFKAVAGIGFEEVVKAGCEPFRGWWLVVVRR
jgi:hypothetical protein